MPLATEAMPEESSLLRVLRNGRQLELADLSRWEVDPGDSTITALWLPTNRLTIEEADGVYRITNLDTSQPDVVSAKRVF
jgi:hypothetical protein